MKLSLYNAFLMTDSMVSVNVCHTCFSKRINVITNNLREFSSVGSGVEVYSLVKEKKDLVGNNICLSSLLLPNDVLDATIDYVLTNKCKFMAIACQDLYTTGLIESKYNLSPIMLLHKIGLLDNAMIVGANYIDKDDIDLMKQCNASVVFLPTSSLGKGYGIPPVNFVLGKLPIAFGTGDNAYNSTCDMRKEANLVRLLCNEQARKENAIDEQTLFNMFGSGDMHQWIKETK